MQHMQSRRPGEEINGLEEYMKTDEYIEKVARDKLGLIYPDEILIKPEN